MSTPVVARPAERRRRTDHRPSPVAPPTAPVAQPEPADRLALMRRVAVSMFVIGGATAVLGAAITARTPSAAWTHTLCGAALMACGLVLQAIPPRRRPIQAALFVGVAVIGALLAGSDPMGMAPLFYLWPTVFAAYFGSRRLAGVVLGWSAVSLAVGLGANEHIELRLDTFVGTIAAVGIMTALVSTMTWREASLRDELAAMAESDPLTGLPNRRTFDRRLAGMIEQGAGGGRVALVVFDLDHFKQYNDRHGHLAGDTALQAVAGVLRRASRTDDVVGRFGGEEFTVALAHADLAAARAYVDRVSAHLAALDLAQTHGLTVSAGICVHRLGQSQLELFDHADRALYAAKAAGRSRSAWFEAGEVSVQECVPAART